ncbi:MAG: ferritin-like domain-containing protein [Deltaproteobacteria bacterium]|nr:ferritin-like domain-containing protein [Deltaproteobacteria bacterium]
MSSTSNEKIISLLNEALAQEYACFIRYSTHASCVKGPNSMPLRELLKEIAKDEWEHADMLRERVVSLGGQPTLQVEKIEYAEDFDEILKINMTEERDAITMYQEILRLVHEEKALLHDQLMHILADEFCHLEKLQRLQSHEEAAEVAPVLKQVKFKTKIA